IIEVDRIDAYVKEVSTSYKEMFHIDLDAIIVVPSEGTVVSNERGSQ
ncbi:hypothetical protein HC175_16805, partial [Salinimicrobium sp. CDJ15-91]|nr:hypothetical protein [Salinimicrobium oceani]